MPGLISLVNDDHMDNYLKEILVYYLGLDYKRSTQKCIEVNLFLHKTICCDYL